MTIVNVMCQPCADTKIYIHYRMDAITCRFAKLLLGILQFHLNKFSSDII